MLAFILAACALPHASQQAPPATTAAPPAALSAPPMAAITATIQGLESDEQGDLSAARVSLTLGGGWTGRALDPVLVVGERRFTDYDYPAPGLLRYTLPDRALLEAGPARVAWSEDDFVDISAAVQEALR